MNRITINGKTIEVRGSNISIVNNKVFVGGAEIDTDGPLRGTVNIKFEGDLASLKCDGDVEVTGKVEGRVDAGGNVQCGDVFGGVDAGGNVTCGQVSGDVDAGGSVKMRR